MRRSSWRLGLFGAVVVVAAGCVVGGRSQDGGTTNNPASGSADKIVRAALSDVERYWSATFPDLSGGKAFQPLKGGYHPYTSTDLPPPCGPEQPQYQPNAFYCPDGDFIAWDSERLLPS